MTLPIDILSILDKRKQDKTTAFVTEAVDFELGSEESINSKLEMLAEIDKQAADKLIEEQEQQNQKLEETKKEASNNDLRMKKLASLINILRTVTLYRGKNE